MTHHSTWKVGINIDGAMNHDGELSPSLEQQFGLIREHFDYVEKTLHAHESLEPWLTASSDFDVPIEVLGGIFQPGEDDARCLETLRLAKAHSIPIVNCQIRPPLGRSEDADLESIGRLYLRMLEQADGSTLPCLEPHVDMWLERFERVAALGCWLAARGAPLHLTIDHSHLIYRIDNLEQLQAAGIDTLEAGRRLLSPDSASAFYRQWQSKHWISHAHARCVQVNAPPNTRMERRAGLPGRGIQYPIRQPLDDPDWIAWDESQCTPWKRAVDIMLQWRAEHPDMLLRRISCEFIPYPDYGGGSRYSLIEQNMACAEWLRARIAQVGAATQAT
ncbi:xylose isomerase [Pseudomonas corrugata]|uniref:Xylose isomerase n=1 Tax=Pseudomonas corrugata TaxID=47879 RepID=A0A7Y6DF26_9PSED|nr:xylose isomerase [Pseudomonas corrugata]NUT85062.1 xylose isomerase [Pseudomonas corrugata]